MDLLLTDGEEPLPEWDGYGCESAVRLTFLDVVAVRTLLLTLIIRAPPSPNTLTAYKAAAAKTNASTSPPHIAGGVFIPLNGTSATGTSTGSASKGVASSTGAGTSISTSSVVPFTGAADRMSSGYMAVVLGAAGVAGLAFL